jgi:hypothetical protein
MMHHPTKTDQRLIKRSFLCQFVLTLPFLPTLGLAALTVPSSLSLPSCQKLQEFAQLAKNTSSQSIPLNGIRTPILFEYAKRGDTCSVQTLLRYIKYGDLRDSKGTPLLVALAALGSQLSPAIWDTVLLSRSISVDSIDLDPQADRRSALHVASARGDLSLVRRLLKAGASVNLVNAFGETPLHLAASHGNLDVVKALLEAKASVSATTRFTRSTPLHLAAESKQHAIYLTLMDSRWTSADSIRALQKMRDQFGKTAADRMSASLEKSSVKQ